MLCCAVFWCAYFLIVKLFVGLRADNFLLGFLFITLFFYNKFTRGVAVALIPFALFAICYDWMRLYPNYMVNSVDIQGINDAERALFGIASEGGRLTPNEFFLHHQSSVADFMAGIFYLCWVPVPIAFGLYLYFTGRRELYAHFAWAFLFVNLIGFAGYYIHPAAPPWYFSQYGNEMILNTPGNVAGLARFDAMTGMNVFQNIYGQNANVFAAVPSLHSAYMLIATIYAFRGRSPWLMRIVFIFISFGIWWTAVYTFHHYLIDVLLGIFTALLGVFILESMVKHCGAVKRFFSAFIAYLE